ncbi:MAG: Asp-tRNA(Asn)/Glu-tRNA(Gln) amidotransferase subunit GatA [Oscillospiraceae bacterium]
MELYQMSATQLAAKLRSKEVSATEIAQSTIGRIKEKDAEIDAFLSYGEEGLLQQAAAVDARFAKGEDPGVLAGIPVGIKDNICTKGRATTCASRMLQNFVPFYDATVIEKLNNAGALLAGKTNMDEFAMGSSCENSYFKPTKNPWDTTKVPGGSSGGSAAAVAACEVPLSLGSDTGGSIRQPAALCGVLGLKPTYGAVSRYGLVAFASSLDQIGPFARTADDLALLYSAIAGVDAGRDSTSKDIPFMYSQQQSLKGVRIGLPKEYYGAGVSAEVKDNVQKAVQQLQQLGADVFEVSLPSTEFALSAYYIISSAEASSNLARYDGVKYGYSAGAGADLTELYETTRNEGFGTEVKRRILLGTHVLSSGYYDAFYKRAKLLQKQIAQEFTSAFTGCDFLLTPTAPTTAFSLGAHVGDPLEMYAADICTVTVNIAGLPALSIPCGTDAAGLPVGMQLIGPKASEGRLISTAKCYETAIGGFAVKGVNA